MFQFQWPVGATPKFSSNTPELGEMGVSAYKLLLVAGEDLFTTEDAEGRRGE
jgi:hypothetical protein